MTTSSPSLISPTLSTGAWSIEDTSVSIKTSPLLSNDKVMPKRQAFASLLLQDSTSAKLYRMLLDQLIESGVEQFVAVPKIVAIGSQSAGKSSIMEAISGINFPRGMGTCTRCPIQLRLFSSKTEEMVCTISLRFGKDQSGNRLKNPRTSNFGGPITDLLKVEPRLRQAQLAILNPSKRSESFLQPESRDGSIEGINLPNELAFSEDMIVIEVRGQGLLDVTLVDLPGLIGNVGENEDKHVIDLIENLAIKECSKGNTIILDCVTMSEDYQVQPSVQLARDADKSGLRRLEVLTKPDRIEEETFEKWEGLIKGFEQKLFHPRHVVKNRLATEGKMTLKQSREREKRFFQKEPWASMGDSVTSRFGSDNLAIKLAALLEQINRDNLPLIISKVKSKHRQVTEALALLPKQVPEEKYVRHLSSLVNSFDKDFKHEVLESQKKESLAYDLHLISLNVWADIINHRPSYLLMTISESQEVQRYCKEEPGSDKLLQSIRELMRLSNFLFEDDRLDLHARYFSESFEHSSGVSDNDGDDEDINMDHDQPRLTRESDGAVEENLKPYNLMERRIMFGNSSLATSGDRLVDFISLSEIRELKLGATRDLLPNNVPWKIKEEMIGASIKSWPELTFLALRDFETRLLQGCRELVKKYFSQFQIGGLDTKIMRIMEKLISVKVEEAKTNLTNLIKLESRYTTISMHDLPQRQAKLKRIFVQARARCSMIKAAKVEPFDLDDTVDDELNLICEILVYWQVAAKRYTDYVRSNFFKILLEPVAAECLDKISTELGINIFGGNASDDLKNLLQEDHNTVKRREELVADEKSLSKALDIIRAFESGDLRVEE